MNTKISEIKEFIWNNIDEEGQIHCTCEFADIYELIEHVNNTFKCDLEVKHCGGFDSPGYDVDCYAWAGIIEGKLYFDVLEECRY